MQNVVGTTIYLTRGDTFKAKVEIKVKGTDEEYTPSSGDVVRFALKKSYSDPVPAILKNIPNDTQMLVLQPEDTNVLDFGEYVYDVQITAENGTVDTFISDGTFVLMKEVF